MSDIKALFISIGIVFGSIGVLFLLIFSGDAYIISYECGKYQEVTGRSTKYAFPGRCYVKSGKEWMSMDEYKSVIIAREGLKNK